MTTVDRPQISSRSSRAGRIALLDEWKNTTRAERAKRGKAERTLVPRAAHAQFEPAPGRDPLGLLERQAQTRVKSLVPIRYGRMAVSPFTFFRGAALPMAADLATTPTTDLYAQLCGDAHLSNFGVFGTPERQLVFDVNDFDETLPGPFEWDVKRLAASIVVAGRANGFDDKATRAVVMATVASYRGAIRALAELAVLDVWYLSENVDKEIATLRAASSSWSKKQRATLDQTATLLDKARRKDNTRAAQKLTVMTADGPRLINDPPLIVPIAELLDGSADAVTPLLHRLVAKYRTTLRRDRQRLLDHFSLVDIAHKVVGVGSVGTRAWVLLMLNADHDETLILQAKEAEQSVLAEYVQPMKFAQQGQRVVTGQLSMQSSSDIFLGWLRAPSDNSSDADYYIRQLWDWKGSIDPATLQPNGMTIYGRLCARILARAHARSGNRIAIAAYLGSSDVFDRAVTEFAVRYANQTDTDHAALVSAIKLAQVNAEHGV